MRLQRRLNLLLERATGHRLVPTCKDGYLDRAREAVLKGNHVELLIDAGAANGDWALHKTPSAFKGQILSIEPQESRLIELREKADRNPRWHVAPVALGEEEAVMNLHVSANQDSSSLLSSTKDGVTYFGDVIVEVGLQRETRVARLDQVVREIELEGLSSWVKMDVQGFEDRLIRGAPDTLKHAQVVEVELIGVPAYSGGARMGQVLTMLVELGFELTTLDHIGYNEKRGVFVTADALFTRPSFPILEICPAA